MTLTASGTWFVFSIWTVHCSITILRVCHAGSVVAVNFSKVAFWKVQKYEQLAPVPSKCYATWLLTYDNLLHPRHLDNVGCCHKLGHLAHMLLRHCSGQMEQHSLRLLLWQKAKVDKCKNQACITLLKNFLPTYRNSTHHCHLSSLQCHHKPVHLGCILQWHIVHLLRSMLKVKSGNVVSAQIQRKLQDKLAHRMKQVE